MLLLAITMVTLVPPAQAAAQVSQKCISQPMPSALDSAGDPPIAPDVVEFAATPSSQYPARAWVVRLSRRGQVDGRIEVFRLRRQEDCNRYNVEARWRAPLRQSEYVAIATRVARVGVPTSSVFVPSSIEQAPDVVLDGTGIDLRLRSQEWQVTRSLNHYSAGGAEISAIFRDVTSKYVPASELPAVDWRTAPGPE